ncbi:hypothetical protein [Tenacibaculum sp. UWU-22]|uniref:hypothetical protein n=1 Tax=Tenacibaculum sp. UWU-22 TaxID=3234187 RepID=UPI0034DB697B
MMRYSYLCQGNEAFCKAFQEYNTYLQLGLLGSGLIRAKFSSVRNNAKEEYFKHREALVNKYGEADVKIKELDRHFGVAVNTAGSLLDNALIAELRAAGVKFTEADLKFVVKNNDNLIMFLEKGNSNAGLQHIIDRHWNSDELMKFFNTQDEMVETLFNAIKNNNYVSRVVDAQKRLSFVYKMPTNKGLREFTVATGDNGFIVSFIPK